MPHSNITLTPQFPHKSPVGGDFIPSFGLIENNSAAANGRKLSDNALGGEPDWVDWVDVDGWVADACDADADASGSSIAPPSHQQPAIPASAPAAAPLLEAGQEEKKRGRRRRRGRRRKRRRSRRRRRRGKKRGASISQCNLGLLVKPKFLLTHFGFPLQLSRNKNIQFFAAGQMINIKTVQLTDCPLFRALCDAVKTNRCNNQTVVFVFHRKRTNIQSFQCSLQNIYFLNIFDGYA